MALQSGSLDRSNIKQTSQGDFTQPLTDDTKQEASSCIALAEVCGNARTSGWTKLTNVDSGGANEISSANLATSGDHVSPAAYLVGIDGQQQRREMQGEEEHLRSRDMRISPPAASPQAQNLTNPGCSHNVAGQPQTLPIYLGAESAGTRQTDADRCAPRRQDCTSRVRSASSRQSGPPKEPANHKKAHFDVRVDLKAGSHLLERVSRSSFISAGRSSIASARSSLVQTFKAQTQSSKVLKKKGRRSSEHSNPKSAQEGENLTSEQQLDCESRRQGCEIVDCLSDSQLEASGNKKVDITSKLPSKKSKSQLVDNLSLQKANANLLDIARVICKDKNCLLKYLGKKDKQCKSASCYNFDHITTSKQPFHEKSVAPQDKITMEHRHSTYSSSIGAATDIQCDSSSSSLNNCHRTCLRTSCTNCTCQEVTICKLNKSKKVYHDCDPPSSPCPGLNERSCDISTGAQRIFISHNSLISRTERPKVKKREHWDKNIEFLLAVIGFAVDLGNVWRFPYICYKNGGGAFLIPYTIMFILGGLPIFYLELSLGQYFSSGCLTVWRRVCPMAKGVGYAMCVLNFFTGLYYNTIISWAVFFFVQSFARVLPWTSCNNVWNSKDCKTIEQRQNLDQFNSSSAELQDDLSTLAGSQFSTPTKDYFEREVLQVHLSSGIDDLGFIRWPLATYLAIVFVCIYFAIWKGVKSTGKAVWITALLPYFVLIPLLIRGVFLEGAWLGIKYYLYPQWSRLLDVQVWVEAAQQIYFSLGPGFGTLMALSSYNRFDHNCKRDALIAASVNYFASFISGLVIFAVLGYMATIENVSISKVATEGPGLVFQVYPEGLATMRYSSMWSVLFFMMVITLGIDSTFGGLESVITGLCDEYPKTLRSNRGVFIGLLIILLYLFSLPTTTNGGNYVICLLESYGTSLSLLLIVLAETIIVCWIYGADKFCKNLQEMYGKPPAPYWRICWKYVSPTILLFIFLAACMQELSKYHSLTYGTYIYPSWAPIAGLLMTGSSVCLIPIYAVYYIRTKTTGSLVQRLKLACTPLDTDRRAEDEIYINAHRSKIKDEKDRRIDTVI